MPTHPVTLMAGILIACCSINLSQGAYAQVETKSDSPENSKPQGNYYTELANYLKAEQWQEADAETRRVMLQVANRQIEGWLNENSIEEFPCAVLQAINQLWSQYSDGHFGFSTQKQIWLDTANPTDGIPLETFYGIPYDVETFRQFEDQLGWRVNDSYLSYNDHTFDISAPQGHLPSTPTLLYDTFLQNPAYLVDRLTTHPRIVILFSRAATCQL